MGYFLAPGGKSVLFFFLLLSGSPTLRAQTTTYSWDANGGGAGSGGTGTWGNAAANTNWTADGTTYVLWSSIANQSNAIASFGGTAGTVSLTASFLANSVEFLTSGYTLQSSTNTSRTITTTTGNVTVGNGLTATMGNAIRFGGSSGFTKLGDGTLILGNIANTTTGANAVSAGTLKLGVNQALGGVSTTLTVSSGATLDLAGFALTNVFLSSAGTITSSAAGGSFTANTTSAADFSGVLSGDMSFTKVGSATLTFSGSSANTYTGTTTVELGALTLNKTAGVNAIAGDLTIGDGSGTDRVNLSASDQIADTSVVTLSSGGTAELRLNGNAETIGALVGGASGVANVLLGTSGSLTIAGTSTSSFAGNINLTNGTLTVGGAANASISGVISGASGNLVKTGTGTLTLSATNTYTGATTISNGTVAVNGRVSGSGVTVKNGGELAGTGTVGSAVIESGGTISPGNSPGTLTLTNGLTLNAGGNYDWEIFNVAGPAGTGWDLIDVQGGALTFSGLSAGTPFNINIFSLSGTDPDAYGPLAGLAPLSTYSWKILQHNATITGFSAGNFTLNTNSFVNNVSSGLFSLELRDSDTSIYLVYTTSGQAIPEPGTWAAAALLSAVAYLRWRRLSHISA